MITMRTRMFILTLLAAASLAAFAAREESVDELIARAESAQPNDRPGLYLKIADLKAKAADKLYNDGNAEAGKAALQDVVAYSKKATDASIATGKKLKNLEITLRKMAEKFRDIKRTVAFEDQAPLQHTVDELEKMRTDLLSAMFGKKKGK
ncbi:MAG: hypothetical protein ACRD3W_12920 [Terriglobales bacterium]